MNILAIAPLFGGGIVGLLFQVAILCIVVWAIFALLTWAGITIPPPIKIILIALACILAVYWLFQAFASLT